MDTTEWFALLRLMQEWAFGRIRGVAKPDDSIHNYVNYLLAGKEVTP